MDGWDFFKLFTKGMDLLMSLLPTWKHVMWFCIGVFVLGLVIAVALPAIVGAS